MFAHFRKFFNMKNRLLVLAHREELLLQAKDKFLDVDPENHSAEKTAGARQVVLDLSPVTGVAKK